MIDIPLGDLDRLWEWIQDMGNMHKLLTWLRTVPAIEALVEQPYIHAIVETLRNWFYQLCVDGSVAVQFLYDLAQDCRDAAAAIEPVADECNTAVSGLKSLNSPAVDEFLKSFYNNVTYGADPRAFEQSLSISYLPGVPDSDPVIPRLCLQLKDYAVTLTELADDLKDYLASLKIRDEKYALQVMLVLAAIGGMFILPEGGLLFALFERVGFEAGAAFLETALGATIAGAVEGAVIMDAFDVAGQIGANLIEGRSALSIDGWEIGMTTVAGLVSGGITGLWAQRLKPVLRSEETSPLLRRVILGELGATAGAVGDVTYQILDKDFDFAAINVQDVANSTLFGGVLGVAADIFKPPAARPSEPSIDQPTNVLEIPKDMSSDQQDHTFRVAAPSGWDFDPESLTLTNGTERISNPRLNLLDQNGRVIGTATIETRQATVETRQATVETRQATVEIRNGPVDVEGGRHVRIEYTKGPLAGKTLDYSIDGATLHSITVDGAGGAGTRTERYTASLLKGDGARPRYQQETVTGQNGRTVTVSIADETTPGGLRAVGERVTPSGGDLEVITISDGPESPAVKAFKGEDGNWRVFVGDEHLGAAEMRGSTLEVTPRDGGSPQSFELPKGHTEPARPGSGDLPKASSGGDRKSGPPDEHRSQRANHPEERGGTETQAESGKAATALLTRTPPGETSGAEGSTVGSGTASDDAVPDLPGPDDWQKQTVTDAAGETATAVRGADGEWRVFVDGGRLGPAEWDGSTLKVELPDGTVREFHLPDAPAEPASGAQAPTEAPHEAQPGGTVGLTSPETPAKRVPVDADAVRGREAAQTAAVTGEDLGPVKRPGTSRPPAAAQERRNTPLRPPTSPRPAPVNEVGDRPGGYSMPSKARPAFEEVRGRASSSRTGRAGIASGSAGVPASGPPALRIASEVPRPARTHFPPPLGPEVPDPAEPPVPEVTAPRGPNFTFPSKEEVPHSDESEVPLPGQPNEPAEPLKPGPENLPADEPVREVAPPAGPSVPAPIPPIMSPPTSDHVVPPSVPHFPDPITHEVVRPVGDVPDPNRIPGDGGARAGRRDARPPMLGNRDSETPIGFTAGDAGAGGEAVPEPSPLGFRPVEERSGEDGGRRGAPLGFQPEPEPPGEDRGPQRWYLGFHPDLPWPVQDLLEAFYALPSGRVAGGVERRLMELDAGDPAAVQNAWAWLAEIVTIAAEEAQPQTTVHVAFTPTRPVVVGDRSVDLGPLLRKRIDALYEGPDGRIHLVEIVTPGADLDAPAFRDRLDRMGRWAQDDPVNRDATVLIAAAGRPWEAVAAAFSEASGGPGQAADLARRLVATLAPYGVGLRVNDGRLTPAGVRRAHAMPPGGLRSGTDRPRNGVSHGGEASSASDAAFDPSKVRAEAPRWMYDFRGQHGFQGPSPSEGEGSVAGRARTTPESDGDEKGAGDGALRDAFDRLPEAVREAVRQYTRFVTPYNTILRASDPVQELRNMAGRVIAHAMAAASFDNRYPSPADIHRRVRLIDTALRTALAEDVHVHRGLEGASFFAGYDGEADDLGLVGSTQIERGFMSTSLGEESAFANRRESPVQLHLDVPKGTNVLYIGEHSWYSDQRELLLPRNTRYEIVEVVAGADGSWDVFAKVLPPEDRTPQPEDAMTFMRRAVRGSILRAHGTLTALDALTPEDDPDQAVSRLRALVADLVAIDRELTYDGDRLNAVTELLDLADALADGASWAELGDQIHAAVKDFRTRLLPEERYFLDERAETPAVESPIVLTSGDDDGDDRVEWLASVLRDLEQWRRQGYESLSPLQRERVGDYAEDLIAESQEILHAGVGEQVHAIGRYLQRMSARAQAGDVAFAHPRRSEEVDYALWRVSALVRGEMRNHPGHRRVLFEIPLAATSVPVLSEREAERLERFYRHLNGSEIIEVGLALVRDYKARWGEPVWYVAAVRGGTNTVLNAGPRRRTDDTDETDDTADDLRADAPTGFTWAHNHPALVEDDVEARVPSGEAGDVGHLEDSPYVWSILFPSDGTNEILTYDRAGRTQVVPRLQIPDLLDPVREAISVLDRARRIRTAWDAVNALVEGAGASGGADGIGLAAIRAELDAIAGGDLSVAENDALAMNGADFDEAVRPALDRLQAGAATPRDVAAARRLRSYLRRSYEERRPAVVEAVRALGWSFPPRLGFGTDADRIARKVRKAYPDWLVESLPDGRHIVIYRPEGSLLPVGLSPDSPMVRHKDGRTYFGARYAVHIAARNSSAQEVADALPTPTGLPDGIVGTVLDLTRTDLSVTAVKAALGPDRTVRAGVLVTLAGPRNIPPAAGGAYRPGDPAPGRTAGSARTDPRNAARWTLADIEELLRLQDEQLRHAFPRLKEAIARGEDARRLTESVALKRRLLERHDRLRKDVRGSLAKMHAAHRRPLDAGPLGREEAERLRAADVAFHAKRAADDAGELRLLARIERIAATAPIPPEVERVLAEYSRTLSPRAAEDLKHAVRVHLGYRTLLPGRDTAGMDLAPNSELRVREEIDRVTDALASARTGEDAWAVTGLEALLGALRDRHAQLTSPPAATDPQEADARVRQDLASRPRVRAAGEYGALAAYLRIRSGTAAERLESVREHRKGFIRLLMELRRVRTELLGLDAADASRRPSRRDQARRTRLDARLAQVLDDLAQWRVEGPTAEPVPPKTTLTIVEPVLDPRTGKAVPDRTRTVTVELDNVDGRSTSRNPLRWAGAEIIQVGAATNHYRVFRRSLWPYGGRLPITTFKKAGFRVTTRDGGVYKMAAEYGFRKVELNSLTEMLRYSGSIAGGPFTGPFGTYPIWSDPIRFDVDLAGGHLPFLLIPRTYIAMETGLLLPGGDDVHDLVGRAKFDVKTVYSPHIGEERALPWTWRHSEPASGARLIEGNPGPRLAPQHKYDVGAGLLLVVPIKVNGVQIGAVGGVLQVQYTNENKRQLPTSGLSAAEVLRRFLLTGAGTWEHGVSREFVASMFVSMGDQNPFVPQPGALIPGLGGFNVSGVPLGFVAGRSVGEAPDLLDRLLMKTPVIGDRIRAGMAVAVRLAHAELQRAARRQLEYEERAELWLPGLRADERVRLSGPVRARLRALADAGHAVTVRRLFGTHAAAEIIIDGHRYGVYTPRSGDPAHIVTALGETYDRLRVEPGHDDHLPFDGMIVDLTRTRPEVDAEQVVSRAESARGKPGMPRHLIVVGREGGPPGRNGGPGTRAPGSPNPAGAAPPGTGAPATPPGAAAPGAPPGRGAPTTPPGAAAPGAPPGRGAPATPPGAAAPGAPPVRPIPPQARAGVKGAVRDPAPKRAPAPPPESPIPAEVVRYIQDEARSLAGDARDKVADARARGVVPSADADEIEALIEEITRFARGPGDSLPAADVIAYAGAKRRLQQKLNDLAASAGTWTRPLADRSAGRATPTPPAAVRGGSAPRGLRTTAITEAGDPQIPGPAAVSPGGTSSTDRDRDADDATPGREEPTG